MKFVDTCEVTVKAGDGGNGSIAFRREKFIPHGGPSGGDGGRGGDIIFVADANLSTLLDLTYQRKIEAKSGENGSGSDCYGHGGDDFVVRVPVGTQVHDTATDEIIADFSAEGQRVVIAQGGRGGRGNIHFATPLDRAPRRAETGDPGDLFDLRLELKVMADVGLLGFPNVGKSTFIRAVSAAKPKVADYPFTTLVPHLGVVQSDDDSFVIADIPGLIPGASEGAGLGLQFLRHVQRTRALLHLVTMSFDEERDPVADYDAIMKELKKYDPALAKRPMVVALSKADVTEVKESYEDLKKRFAKKRVKLRLISSATQEGITDMLRELRELVRTSNLQLPAEEPEEPVVVRAPKVIPKRKKPSEM